LWITPLLKSQANFNLPHFADEHYKNRLKADFSDGKAVTRVLDKDGNVSAASLEDLEKEILANPEYKPFSAHPVRPVAVPAEQTGAAVLQLARRLAELILTPWLR
jgi:hypothetical protein